MEAQVVFLRGINVGKHNRMKMPDLREALVKQGFEDPQTYLQSGNLLLTSDLSSSDLADKVSAVIKESFGFDVATVTRSAAELAAVVEKNPLADTATELKRYLVTFLSEPVEQEKLDRLAETDFSPEQYLVDGEEIYSWHPEGVYTSKLSTKLTDKHLGVTATARNWNTVVKMLELASAVG